MSILSLRPVFRDSNESVKAFEYLKKQKYLKLNNIKPFIKNNFEDKLPFGYNLYNGSENLVGFLGTMFSYRTTLNLDFLYCNLHTWIVDEKYRLSFFSESEEILKKIFSYKCTFFAKPSKSLIRIFLRKFNMSVLKMKYRVNFLLNLKNLILKNNFTIIEKKSILEEKLDNNEKKIFSDHKNLKCNKFLIIDKKDEKNNIFVIALKKKKKFSISTLEIIYCSDIKKLRLILPSIAFKIAFNFNVLFCSQYFFNEEGCILKKQKILKDRNYEVVIKDLPPEFQLDTLYSELVY
mgnify:CR=1 FL=1